MLVTWTATQHFPTIYLLNLETSISYMSSSHVDYMRISDYVNFVAAHSATAYSNDVEWPAT